MPSTIQRWVKAQLCLLLMAAGAAAGMLPQLTQAQVISAVTSNLDDGGPGTLRSRIEAVNVACGAGGNPGPFDIYITVSGTLQVSGTPLPTILCSRTRIIGATLRRPFLDGSILRDAEQFGPGLAFSSDTFGNEVRNLAIGNFAGNGIAMDSASSTVTGSYLGVRDNGSTPAGNSGSGLTLGPGGRATNNIISNNGLAGIRVQGNSVTLQNNTIGLTVGGGALGNGWHGVDIGLGPTEQPSTGTTIRGNVIGANGGSGIDASGSVQTFITGNRVGVNQSGAERGNALHGIHASGARRARIGSAGLQGGNEIAYNGLCGVTATSDQGETTVEVSQNSIFLNGVGANTGGGTGGIARFFCDLGQPLEFPKNSVAPLPGILGMVFTGPDSSPTTRIVWGGDNLPPGPVSVEFFENRRSDLAQGERFVGACSQTVPPPSGLAGTGRTLCDVTFPGVIANPTFSVTTPFETVTGFERDTAEFGFPVFTPSASALSVTFPPTAVGGLSPTRSVTITNDYSREIVVESVVASTNDFRILSPATSPPAVSSSACAVGLLLQPGASCTLEAVFTPQEGGVRSASLTLLAQEPVDLQVRRTFGFAIAATGTATSLDLTASLSWSANPVVGGAKVDLLIRLTNDNVAPASGVGGSVPLGSLVQAGTGLFGAGCSAGVFTSAAGAGAVSFSSLGIAAGTSCTIAVPVAVPQTGGAFSVSLAANAIQGLVLATAVGSVATVSPQLVVTALSTGFTASPAALAFGPVALGLASPSQSVTVSNGGSSPLILGSPVFTIPTHFRVVATSCIAQAPLAPGASCTAQVVFEPRLAPGAPLTGALAINSAGGGTALVSLSGTGTSQPIGLVWSVASGSIGGSVGDTALLALSITNPNGASYLAGGSYTLTPLPAPVAVDGPPSPLEGCQGQVAGAGGNQTLTLSGLAVPAGGSCRFTVPIRYASAGGGVVQTLAGVLAGSVLDQAGIVSAASNALALGGAVAPVISASPVSLDFGVNQLGTPSQPSDVTIRNVGTGALLLSRIFSAGDFGFASTCPLASGGLAGGESCVVRVSFVPLVAGDRRGSLFVDSNDPITPRLDIPLSGRGAAPPVGLARVEPDFLAFPDTLAGGSSGPLVAVLQNLGEAVLPLQGVGVTGAAFQATSTCAASLAPGEACEIRVVFSPVASGLFSGEVAITTGAGERSVVALQGRGITAPIGRIVTEPPNLTFGERIVNTTSTPATLTLRNVGAARAPVTSVTSSGDYRVSGGCSTIEPGATCTWQVTFTPSTLGERPGVITFNTLAEPPTVIVPASGRGIAAPAPRASLSATSLGFASTLVGTQARQAVAIANVGTAPLLIASLSATGDFRVSSNCPAALAPGEACTLDVAFQPSIPGGRNGSVVVVSNDPTGPATLGLSGSGCRVALTGTSFAIVCRP